MNSYSSFSVLGHLHLSDSGIACGSIGSFVMQRMQAIQRNRIKPMLSIFYDKPIVLGRYVDSRWRGYKARHSSVGQSEKVAKVIEVTCPSDYGLNIAEHQNIKI